MSSLNSGTVSARDRLQFGRDRRAKVTAISAFERGAAVRRGSVVAGQIAKLWGLGDVQIGDAIGTSQARAPRHHFAPPTLETVIVPARPSDHAALHTALAQLAEQDPLINLRQDDAAQQMFVSLNGEVQKEVIAQTLASDFRIDVEFLETTTICVERPIGTGAVVETMHKAPNPFDATIGLRIDPAAIDSGVEFRLEVEFGSIPLPFHRAVDDTVKETLRQGLYGWHVTDCAVTMTHSGYSSPTSVAADFRNLTPLVLMDALKQAGTQVCEPMQHFRLEAPADTLGSLLPVLSRLDAIPQTPVMRGASCVVEGEIPAGHVHRLQQQAPRLTRGEGVLEHSFGRYRPVRGPISTRPRSDFNPLNRKEYMLHVMQRI